MGDINKPILWEKWENISWSKEQMIKSLMDNLMDSSWHGPAYIRIKVQEFNDFLKHHDFVWAREIQKEIQWKIFGRADQIFFNKTIKQFFWEKLKDIDFWVAKQIQQELWEWISFDEEISEAFYEFLDHASDMLYYTVMEMFLVIYGGTLSSAFKTGMLHEIKKNPEKAQEYKEKIKVSFIKSLKYSYSLPKLLPEEVEEIKIALSSFLDLDTEIKTFFEWVLGGEFLIAKKIQEAYWSWIDFDDLIKKRFAEILDAGNVRYAWDMAKVFWKEIDLSEELKKAFVEWFKRGNAFKCYYPLEIIKNFWKRVNLDKEIIENSNIITSEFLMLLEKSHSASSDITVAKQLHRAFWHCIDFSKEIKEWFLYTYKKRDTEWEIYQEFWNWIDFSKELKESLLYDLDSESWNISNIISTYQKLWDWTDVSKEIKSNIMKNIREKKIKRAGDIYNAIWEKIDVNKEINDVLLEMLQKKDIKNAMLLCECFWEKINFTQNIKNNEEIIKDAFVQSANALNFIQIERMSNVFWKYIDFSDKIKENALMIKEIFRSYEDFPFLCKAVKNLYWELINFDDEIRYILSKWLKYDDVDHWMIESIINELWENVDCSKEIESEYSECLKKGNTEKAAKIKEVFWERIALK